MSMLWLIGSLGLLAALAATGLALARGAMEERVVAFQAASALAASLIVVLAAALAEPNYLDLAIALSLTGGIGTLIVARFLERWL
ncbi:monovalent cation/H+ antiporter complex subunit F [Salinarimonas sp.]|uniref:monovalent cation/H+ antiporter complex subunit F n=1 Tax=Salinarimonas sp. TaxID=2766526 RepID=UPI00391A0AA2